MNNKKCVCHDCDNKEDCKLHEVYSKQKDGCQNGQNPITECTIKNK